MYKTILITLDGTATDRAIIEHIKPLAKQMQSRVVLLHVVTGVPAKVHGTDAAGREVADSQANLDQVRAEFTAAGIAADTELAYGEPVKEIVHWIRQKNPDLVAMSTHGHRFMADLVLGTTAITVQHSVSVPVLLLRAR
ncbi:MAG: universal stress protein [Verrucomicrobiota bacterium]|jgi:nucleotide-binding universal stress UspA family protein